MLIANIALAMEMALAVLSPHQVVPPPTPAPEIRAYSVLNPSQHKLEATCPPKQPTLQTPAKPK